MKDKLLHIILFLPIILLGFFLPESIPAQNLPQDLDCSLYTEALLDAGILWQANSAQHPLQTDELAGVFESKPGKLWMPVYLEKMTARCSEQAEDQRDVSLFFLPGFSSAVQSGAASEYKNAALSFYFYSGINVRRHFYARLYFRTTSEEASLEHFTGYSRNIRRAGMDAAEIDQAVMGYKNDWLNIEYGRSRQIWGPFSDANIVLSGSSPAYENLKFSFKHKRFSYSWFFGFLESLNYGLKNNFNRYLTGRIIEYRNFKNLVLSAGEISILSGENRPLDLAFLNPISVHLEIENNHRQNQQSENNANDAVFLNADWLVRSSLRLAGTLLVDEFQIDQGDRNTGGPDAIGLIGHLAWTPVNEGRIITLTADYVRNGSFVMRHPYGDLNFVSHGEILGYPQGNDMDDVSFGVRMINKKPLMTEIKIGKRRWGENSLLVNEAYEDLNDYTSTKFPSGDLKENVYLKTRFNYRIRDYLCISLDGHWDLDTIGAFSSLERWTFTINYYHPLFFNNL